MPSNYEFEREDGEQIWWVVNDGTTGPLLFSFDRQKVYNYWTDYPDKLSPEELEIFDREQPLWAMLRGR